jgi:hypothetical protein
MQCSKSPLNLSSGQIGVVRLAACLHPVIDPVQALPTPSRTKIVCPMGCMCHGGSRSPRALNPTPPLLLE